TGRALGGVLARRRNRQTRACALAAGGARRGAQRRRGSSMTGFAGRCGIHDMPRESACQRALQTIAEQRIERVRIAWCDLHGVLRGKTLMVHALPDALRDGLGMVSTMMLKDTSDRTAFKVFEPGLADELPGFGQANNLVLLPDPATFRVLPWAPSTGW